MAIPPEVISEIKYKTDIESVISPYVTLKRRGKNLVGLCPFHNEKTPSFTVYPENGSFYCFGCGKGGDIFTFTGLIENLDYIESVRALAERAGVDIPENGYDDSMKRLRSTVLAINRETARFYHAVLMSREGKWASDYLTGRGLVLDTIRHFGLGCAPDGWDKLLRHLTAKGYTVAEMVQANVVSKSSRGTYYDRFRNRVMFPIIDLRGNVVAFSGRIRPGDDKAGGKYVNSTDTIVYKKSNFLYGFNFAKNCCADRVILVEGNMDVVSLHQAGFENTVAALGTAFTLEQAKLLSRYTKEIIITLDSDAAGQKAVRRALETLKNSGMPIRILVLPEGKDPDEYIKSHSADKFRALLDNAVTDIEYKLNNAAKEVDTLSDRGKLEFLRKAAEILAETDDSMAVDLYEGRLSEQFGVAKAAIDAAVRERRKEVRTKEHKKEIAQVINPPSSASDVNPEKRFHKRACAAEETVLSILFQHPDHFVLVEDTLPAEMFVTELNRRIYRMMLGILKDGDSVELSALGSRLSPQEMGYAVSLQNSVKAQNNAAAVLKDSIKILREESTYNKSQGDEDKDDADWLARMQRIVDTKKGD